jgi:hypothetical protein
MATYTVDRLGDVNIGVSGSYQTLYTVPASQKAKVNEIFISNIGSSVIKVTINMFGKTWLNAMPLGGGQVFQLTLGQVLRAGETIQVMADTAGWINATASGVVIS